MSLMNIVPLLSPRTSGQVVRETCQSARRCVTQIMSATTLARERYSDSQLQHEIVGCFMELHKK